MRKNIFLSLLLTLCLASCKNIISMNDLDKGNVNVQLPGAYSARTIGEEPEDPLSIEYTVNLSKLADESLTTKTGKPGDLITFEELEPGKYNVSIKYESNIFLLAGETQVEVQAGKTAEAKVTLKDATVFSDPHVTVEQSPEYGIKFTIKRLAEDMDKYWGSPRIMNYNYGVGLEAVNIENDNYDELVYYWPFAEKGKKYVFELANTRGNDWVTAQISVVYKEETTKYKLNVNQLNYYFDNVQLKVNKNENEYTLSFDGIEKGFEHKIFENLEVTEGFVNAEYWASNDENSLLGKYIVAYNYSFNQDLHSEKYDVSDLVYWNCGYSYGYKYSSFNVRPNFWSETFENQIFYLNQIVTNTFDVNLPLKNKTEHFMAERVDDGIKITILKDEKYDYDTYDWNFMRILNWDNNYSFVFDKSITDVIKEKGSYSFIWPLSDEGENVNLELQYFLDTPESEHPCLCEYLTVLSGKGTSYTPGNYYDNGNMFTIYDDDTGVNSKRILKINVPYEKITQRIPQNVVSGSLVADFSIEGSSHKNPFTWDETRNGIINFTGSFNKLFEKSEPIDGDLSYYISQLFTDGFDIAGIHPYWWNKGPELFAKLQGRYIIPSLTIYFKIQNNDALGQFAVMNQTGVVDNKPLKHPNVYAEQCEEGIKFTVTKTSEFNSEIGIGDEQTGMKIFSGREKNIQIGESFEIIDSLVEKNNTYTFHLEGFDENGKYGYGDQIEFYYTGETKGIINKDILENDYKKLHAKIDYFEEKDEISGLTSSSIGLKIEGDGSRIVNNNDFIKFLELEYQITVEGDFWSSEKDAWIAGISIKDSNDFSLLFSEHGLNLADYSTKNYFGYLKDGDWISSDCITFLADYGKTYLDLFTTVTINSNTSENGPCAGMVYRFPGLTNIWVDDNDCFEFTEYPDN